MTATEKMTTFNGYRLHDAALEAFHERAKESEAQRRARRHEIEEKKTRLLLDLLYKRLGVDLSASDVTAEWGDEFYDSHSLSVSTTVDGMTFSAYERSTSYITAPEDKQVLYLVGKCEGCGARTGSDNIRNLADLGSIIHDWVPHCRGGCEVEEDEAEVDENVQVQIHGNITEQQLLGAIRDLIREETQHA